MTALEMQFALLRNARKMIATGVVDGSIADKTDRDAVQLLPTAVPFSWSRDVAKAVWLASKTIPEDAILAQNLLPEGVHTAFWWFEDPLPIPMEHGQDIEGCETRTINGLLLCCDYAAKYLIVIDARMTDLGPMATGASAFPLGRTLREVLNGARLDPVDNSIKPPSAHGLERLKFVLAATVWLDQRIISIGRGHIERHRRKQIAREHDVPAPKDVQVIQLRRFESEAREAGTSHESIEWSCRWIVNGHWRNQVYANDERKLIYIMPFVKGPADKPLKVPTHTVYQVNR